VTAALLYREISSPPGEWTETVRGFLREFNQASNPVFWAAWDKPEHNRVPLHIFALDAHETVVGGLLGSTRFLWLSVDIVAIREDIRRTGVGRELMRRAEAEATARGCTRSFVETMDYQAPEFYEKLGYRIAGRLENWDSHGHGKFFLVKVL
jgi:GNAT superfamily N-acetyltransferase